MRYWNKRMKLLWCSIPQVKVNPPINVQIFQFPKVVLLKKNCKIWKPMPKERSNCRRTASWTHTVKQGCFVKRVFEICRNERRQKHLLNPFDTFCFFEFSAGPTGNLDPPWLFVRSIHNLYTARIIFTTWDPCEHCFSKLICDVLRCHQRNAQDDLNRLPHGGICYSMAAGFHCIYQILYICVYYVFDVIWCYMYQNLNNCIN